MKFLLNLKMTFNLKLYFYKITHNQYLKFVFFQYFIFRFIESDNLNILLLKTAYLS